MLKPESLSDRTMSAAAWTFSSILTQGILQIVITSILAHFIPPEEFGLFAIASLVNVFVGLFAQIGMGPTVVQRKELTGSYISNAYVISIAFGILGFAITFLGSPLIAVFFNQPAVTNIVRAESIVLLLSGYSSITMFLLQREFQFKRIGMINISSYLIGYGLIGCCVAFIRRDAWAIVAASISQSLAIAMMLLWAQRRFPNLKISKLEIKELLTFSSGVTLAQIFANIAYYIDNVIVGKYLGSMALGLYQMSFQIMDLPRRFFGSVVDQVSFVVMSRVQDDQKRLQLGYFQSLNIANLILVPITVIMVICTPELVAVILGNKWSGAILPLQILLIQVPIRATVRAADQVSTAVGKVYQLAQYKVIYIFLIAVAALIGIRWGITGVAVMVTLAVLINWGIMIRFTLHIVQAGLQDYFRTWSSPLIIGVVIALPTYIASYYLRQIIAVDLIRLIIIVFLAIILFIGLIYIWPKVLGTRNIRLVLDFGKKAPKFSGIFVWLEQKFFLCKVPELNT